MQEPYLSIIIPAYNAEKTIGRLVDSIFLSKRAPAFEMVVVDDVSTDKTSQTLKSPKLLRSLRIVRHRTNRGPAAARNTGAQKARGAVLLFLDSDVVVFPDTLYQVAKAFNNDPDLFALTGVWDKEQQTSAFFPRFKALRDWSYWTNERDQRGYYYLFSTRVAAIRRDLFLRLGGFDESYKKASVEDIEFTYRVARRYAVVFEPKVRVKHEFETFWAVARKYFIRSHDWSALYATRGKFDPVAATRSEAVTAVSAVGFLGSLVLLIFMRGIRGVIGVKGELIELLFLLLLFCFLLLHLYGVRKFLWFVYREEGLLFAIKSFFMGLILYIIIVLGSAAFTREKFSSKFNSCILNF